MKTTILSLAFIATALFAATGCSDNGDDKPSATELSLTPKTLSFEAAGGSQSFAITCNGSWTISGTTDWCTIEGNKMSGTGNQFITVEVATNPGANIRDATIKVTSGAVTQTVGITQEAAELNVQERIDLPAEGGTGIVNIECNTSWEITDYPEWCTVTPLSGTGDGMFEVTVAENLSVDPLSDTITITAGNITQYIEVVQAGALPELTVSETISFTAEGGTQNLEITTNTDWEITDYPSWCTITTLSGTGDASVEVTVAENTSESPQTGTITITAGELSETTDVDQAGATPVD